MKPTIRIFGVSFLLAFILLGATTHEAKADFDYYLDPPNPKHFEKFFIDKINSPTLDFHGHVGGQDHPAPLVNVVSVGNAITEGSGWATIKPADGLLTKLTFTPVDPNLFGDFTFRGQLAGFDPPEVGTITVQVLDNQGHGLQTFNFDIETPNADFERIGIISTDGETIQSVVILSDSFNFNQVKQIAFSYAEGVTPIPEPATMLLLGAGLIGLAGYGRKKFLKK